MSAILGVWVLGAVGLGWVRLVTLCWGLDRLDGIIVVWCGLGLGRFRQGEEVKRYRVG